LATIVLRQVSARAALIVVVVDIAATRRATETVPRDRVVDEGQGAFVQNRATT
jgi:hypothetical protein